jgi:hypothetical protein
VPTGSRLRGDHERDHCSTSPAAAHEIAVKPSHCQAHPPSRAAITEPLEWINRSLSCAALYNESARRGFRVPDALESSAEEVFAADAPELGLRQGGTCLHQGEEREMAPHLDARVFLVHELRNLRMRGSGAMGTGKGGSKERHGGHAQERGDIFLDSTVTTPVFYDPSGSRMQSAMRCPIRYRKRSVSIPERSVPGSKAPRKRSP